MQGLGHRRLELGVMPLALLLAAACTGSEKQLFSPERPTKPISGEPDAGGTDGAVPHGDSGPGPDDDVDDSGVVLIGLQLDPDASFDWAETQPGQAGACEPGTYTGTFECTTLSGTGLGQLIGSIQITLEASAADPKKLTIAKGHMSGFAGGSNELFSSSLVGELTCAGAKLAASSSKSSVFPFPGFGDDLTMSMLSATLNGSFDAEALSIAGEVVVMSDAGFHCAGPFTLRASR